VQNAKRSWSSELRAGVGDGEFVGFIFSELLDLLAAVIDVNLQGRIRSSSFGAEQDSGLL